MAPIGAQEILIFVRSFVCLFGPSLSRALILHLSSSNLQAISQQSTSSQSVSSQSVSSQSVSSQSVSSQSVSSKSVSHQSAIIHQSAIQLVIIPSEPIILRLVIS